jgi:hypothetical protein
MTDMRDESRGFGERLSSVCPASGERSKGQRSLASFDDCLLALVCVGEREDGCVPGCSRSGVGATTRWALRGHNPPVTPGTHHNHNPRHPVEPTCPRRRRQRQTETDRDRQREGEGETGRDVVTYPARGTDEDLGWKVTVSGPRPLRFCLPRFR